MHCRVLLGGNWVPNPIWRQWRLDTFLVEDLGFLSNLADSALEGFAPFYISTAKWYSFLEENSLYLRLCLSCQMAYIAVQSLNKPLTSLLLIPRTCLARICWQAFLYEAAEVSDGRLSFLLVAFTQDPKWCKICSILPLQLCPSAGLHVHSCGMLLTKQLVVVKLLFIE